MPTSPLPEDTWEQIAAASEQYEEYLALSKVNDILAGLPGTPSAEPTFYAPATSLHRIQLVGS